MGALIMEVSYIQVQLCLSGFLFSYLFVWNGREIEGWWEMTVCRLLYSRSVFIIYRCLTEHPEFSCLTQECIFIFHDWWIAKHRWAHVAWGFSSNLNQWLDETAVIENLNLLDTPGGSLASLEVGSDYLLAAQQGLFLGVPECNFPVWPELPNNPNRPPWALWCSFRVAVSLSHCIHRPSQI